MGTRLGGGDQWAGIPTATYQVGAAAAAVVWGIALDRIGRRPTLVLGSVIGAVGAALAGYAVARHDLSRFLLGILLMGMAQSALQLGRFVAAEVHAPADRGRAISRVVVGATLGAIFGPLAVGPAGTMAAHAGLDPLAGPYAVSACLFVVIPLLLGLFLRPDPGELGRRVERATSVTGPVAPRALAEIFRDSRAALAVTTMVCGQLVMVMLMVITSVHMAHHHHPLSSIAAVISSHVFGMFAFSVVSGRLTDTLGRIRVIAIGAALLVVACATAPLSLRVFPLAASLMLLGLGWNFCYVAGTTLLADRLTAGERGRAQGFNDFLMGAVSAAGSVLSGLVFAGAGYTWMAAVGGVVAAMLLAAALVALRAGLDRAARGSPALPRVPTRRLPWRRAAALAAALLATAFGVRLAVFPSTRPLVSGDFRATDAQWSPTGDHLAFVLEDKVGAHLAVFDLATGRHVVLGDIPGTDANAFSWSPDGERLAYVGAGDAGEDLDTIRVFDLARDRSQALARGALPRFRPDGSLVAVCGPEALAAFDSDSEDSDRRAAVYDMANRFCRIDTGTGAVTRTALAAEPGMALSPRLDRVVFARPTGDALGADRVPDVEVFTADLERGEHVRLTAPGEAAFPRWTAAGDRILYARNGAAGMEFWTMRADGGDRRPLLEGVKVTDPESVTISSDGRTVYFIGPVEGDQGVAKATTSEEPADLHMAPVGDGPARRLSNRHAFKRRFVVSPDGRRIVYEVVADAKTPGGAANSEIWLMKR